MIRKMIIVGFLFSVHTLFAQAPQQLNTLLQIVDTDTLGGYGAYAAGVGDMNKDGYADWAVSDSHRKLTYLYYGAKNPTATRVKTFLGGGKIVSGDFNGDGWRDLAIAYYFTDTVFVYYGGSNMDTIPGLILHSDRYSPSGIEGFGYDGLQAGDINGDGYDDLVIGQAEYPYDFSDRTKTFKGKISLYVGSSNGLDTNTVWSVVGDTAFARLGSDIALGDINGDGKKDIVALGWNTISHVSNDWHYYISVFLGDSLYHLKQNYYIDERNIAGGFEEHVASFDVDGDGIDDILVNRILVFKGGNNLDTIPTYYIPPPYNDTSAYGSYPWVSGGGDFNGDGKKDLLLTSGFGGGAPGFVVFFGRKGTIPQFLAYRSFPDNYIDPLDGLASNAGDINGDGVDDIIMTSSVGWPHYVGFVGIYSGDINIKTAVKSETKNQPNNFDLKQNYPNPFNPETVISYKLAVNSDVILKIFDALGKEVVTLINDQQAAGEHKVGWNGKSSHGQQVTSGIYYYRLQINNKVMTKKAVLVK